jgi:hypothetical protein
VQAPLSISLFQCSFELIWNARYVPTSSSGIPDHVAVLLVVIFVFIYFTLLTQFLFFFNPVGQG